MRFHDFGLVLAAGCGRRFGQPKAGVMLNGERLVDRSIRLLHEAGCESVTVVLGAWVQPLTACRVVVNEQWSSGLASSLRCGLNALSIQDQDLGHNAIRAVVTLVDLPGLTAPAIRRVLDVEHSLVAASYRGQQGHPVVIGQLHWPALIPSLKGDRGAGGYLKLHRDELFLVDVSDLATGEDWDEPLSNSSPCVLE